MNAEQARKQAQEVIIKESERQYLDIKSCISKAVQAGRFEIQYFKEFRPEVRTTLENEGYTVSKTTLERNESTTKISW